MYHHQFTTSIHQSAFNHESNLESTPFFKIKDFYSPQNPSSIWKILRLLDSEQKWAFSLFFTKVHHLALTNYITHVEKAKFKSAVHS